MSGHSPLPWALSAAYDHLVCGPDGRAIFECWFRGHKYPGIGADARANAAFIVRACNSHDDLLAAAKVMERVFNLAILNGQLSPGTENSEIANAMRAAIVKAEGVAPIKSNGDITC